MNLETVKELMELMKENSLVELDYQEKDIRIRLKKEGAVAPPTLTVAPGVPQQVIAPQQGPVAETQTSADAIAIKSPMVGTFYGSPSPDTKPFITVGDRVNEEDVVCILEAMKVMNEIKSDVSGIVKEVLVKNGEPVEYGQNLFILE